ncbi:MAG: S46 family peptidase [Bacteroidales bacterium]|nr:S46 family peptidase [Bacteroidales bacterium]
MKKIILTIAAFLSLGIARADEGMWLLPMLQKFNEDAMRNIGCRLTAEDIYNINHASLKDAIVQFGGGCTGEVISQQGLLSTNHHCGYGSIQRLSTPEKNYLEDGFFAKSLEEEIPVPGLTVKFLVSMEDVTDKLASIDDTVQQDGKISARLEAIRDMEKAAEEANPHCNATTISFYNNNVWYLIVYKTYKDIRFVGAPPASMGKFGGETDNWMWPRHTCDFSLFRIYADADNEPADYSKDNKPYTPVRSLKISLKGVQEGDFTFIMGYPGRTQRFQTAAELEEMMAINKMRVDARTVRQNVMWEQMESDPVIRLKYANKFAGSANGWKKWQGEELAFKKLNIIGREKDKEASLTKWIGKKKARKEKYGDAIETIDKVVSGRRDAILAITLLSETVGNIEWVEKEMGSPRFREQDYDKETDRKIAKALLAFYLDRVRPEDKLQPKGWDLTKENSDAYVDWLFQDDNKEGVEDASSLFESRMKTLFDAYRVGSGEYYGQARKDFAAALLEWQKGKASYPDANFTMRLTYGSVKPYSPKDGVSYWYWCTANGILEKENPDDYEFRVPAKVHDLIVNKDFGRWADKDGQLHTCFLSNNDITGGNSGSPVLDADGNLIGLAFDGNWESMSSDVMFEPDLQRCINVDIRYVLWMVEKWGEAHNIIKELEFAK